jgi:D-alanyl-D-alanine carboxypeptidase (penicillin-binding protein 5/6)
MYKLILALFLVINFFVPDKNLVESYNQKVNSWFKNNQKPTISSHKQKEADSGWLISINSRPEKKTNENYLPQAKASLSQDLASSVILTSHDEDTRLPIASLTKLMTAYLVLKESSLDKIIIIPQFEIRAGDSQAGFSPGEKASVDALLKGLLINSGSDAAQSLATSLAGSKEAFVLKMNQAAQDLGLSKTNFTNPVGWDEQNNYSTVRDMDILSRILLNNNYFRKVVATKDASIRTLAGRTIPLANTNLLLDNNYLGLKTGYTAGAGECLTALNKTNNHEVLTVIIGSYDRFSQTRLFSDWINNNFLW